MSTKFKLQVKRFFIALDIILSIFAPIFIIYNLPHSGFIHLPFVKIFSLGMACLCIIVFYIQCFYDSVLKFQKTFN